MTSLEMIRLVATRELRERAVRKPYVIGTLATLALVAGAIIVPTLVADDAPGDVELGVVGEAPADLATQLDPALGEDQSATVTELADRSAGEQALDDDEVDAVLVERRELLVEGMPDAGLHAALEGVLQQEAMAGGLEQVGLDHQELAAVMETPPPLEVVDTSGMGEGGEAFLIALIATVLLVVGVQMAGAALLNGALEEKSNRVVEVLVSAARPWHLLTAKVIATSLLTFMQIGLVVAVALAANAAVDAFPLPDATGTVLWVSALMLVAGFLFYAALFTVAGTMAATVEDAQSAAGPLYIAMWGTYGLVFATVMPNPDGVVSQILTFLPPTAPFVVPARLALDGMPMWQLAAAAVITLVGAGAMMRLAGRLYAASLLAGGKLSWKEAMEAEPVR